MMDRDFHRSFRRFISDPATTTRELTGLKARVESAIPNHNHPDARALGRRLLRDLGNEITASLQGRVPYGNQKHPG